MSVTARAVAQQPGSARLSAVIQTDIDGFSQDSAGRAQVGRVPTVGEVRELRLAFKGCLSNPVPWTYSVQLDAAYLYRKPVGAGTRVNELNLGIPIGASILTIGRQDEGVMRQMIESRNDASFMERSPAVLTFLPPRNDGLRLTGAAAHDRFTWSAGVFNDF